MSFHSFHELPSNDIFQDSFHSLLAVHYERPEVADKDIEHLAENSSDSDDTVNDTDFGNIPAVSLTFLISQPESFDQSELSNLVYDLDLSKELVKLLVFRLSKKHILKACTNVSFFFLIDKKSRRYSQEDGVFVTWIDIR